MESPLQITFGARQRAFLSSSSDFHKQKTLITRRIHRTRRHLQIQQKSKDYVKHDISEEEYSKDQKYHILSLLSVERDFLYASELRLGDGNQKLIITRLKRALDSSKHLLSISSKVNQITRLELCVYSELIRGQLRISTKKWDQAIVAYSLARCALQALETNGFDENRALYKDIIEENIDDSLKLAIYRSSKVTTADLTEYSKVIVQDQTDSEIFTIVSGFNEGSQYLSISHSDVIKKVNWRSYTAKIHDETTARLLTQVQAIKLDSLQAFDNKLSLLQNALETHQSFISRNDDDDEQDDQILLSFIKYTLLLTRAQRDVSLLADANKQESLRIIDTIKTTVKEVSDLPGVYSDDDLHESLEAVIGFLESKRLVLLSEVYVLGREYSKALTLYTCALNTLRDAKLVVEFDGILTIEELATLNEEVVSTQRQLHVLTELEPPAGHSVADSLDIFVSSHKRFVAFNIESIPSKPVLFDQAFNYISYPAQRVLSREQSPEEDKPKKGGLFGFLRG